MGAGASGDLGAVLGVRRLGCGGGGEDGRTANGKQVEGLPESQPGDRLAGMAQSVGEPVNSQIILGNRLRDAHSYSLCVKWAVVKLAFSSFSCH